MAEQNLTVWQRLSKTFGPNSLLNQDYPTFKFDKKELLKQMPNPNVHDTPLLPKDLVKGSNMMKILNL